MEEKFCASFRRMPRGRNTKIGEIDVRSDKDIPGFEQLIMTGPLTLVYVHADFCGHCKNFSENVWSKVPKSNMPINAASVHYDMLDKTSLKNAKIEGYPSLLLVGKNKQPAEFKDEAGTVTNAMTEPPKTPQELEQLLSTQVPNTVKNANSVVKTVVNNMSRVNSIQPSVQMPNTPAPELMTSGEKRNVFKPVSVEALEGPPLQILSRHRNLLLSHPSSSVVLSWDHFLKFQEKVRQQLFLWPLQRSTHIANVSQLARQNALHDMEKSHGNHVGKIVWAPL